MKLTSSHTAITFENIVGVQPTYNSWLRWVGTGLRRLLADAEQVGDHVAIHNEGGIAGELGQVVVHVEACTNSAIK